MYSSSFDADHFAEINGTNLGFHLNDMLVGDYLFEQVVIKKEYLPKEITFTNLANIVDIGANVGLFSCLMSAMFPDSKIFAFEPALSNIARMQEHLALNKIENVTLYPFALGSTNENRELFLPHDEGAYSLFESNASLYTRGKGYTGKSYSVVVRNAREALLESGIETIDFLKIDCEGAELEILEAITPQLKNTKRIAIEWHPNVNIEFIESILHQNSFRYFRKFERFKNGDPSLSMGTLFGSKA